MSITARGRIGLACLFATALWGCAHTVTSPELRREARRDLDFPVVLRDPMAHTGALVIWGGVIVETRVRRDGTDVVVLETPFRNGEEPGDRIQSRGRFIATTSGYLDPAVYRQGLGVTVAGEIAGKEVRPLGESEYAYPLLRIREIHLWQSPPMYGYTDDPYYRGYPYRGPWFGPDITLGFGWFLGSAGHHHHSTGVRAGVGLRGNVR